MNRQPKGSWAFGSWAILALASTTLVVSSRWMWRTNILPAAAPNVSAGAVVSVVDGAGADAADLTRDPFRDGGLLPNAVARLRPPADTVLPVSVAAIRLLGTVVRASGSFALCQLPADVPRIVHVGDRLGELTLVLLEQGHVVFQAPKGARLELLLSNSRS